MSFWTEIRNDFFETEFTPQDGDVLASVCIDAWKTPDPNEEGEVIAVVLLSKNGDILVDYRDGIARTDEDAQAAIKEAKNQLKEHFKEHQAKLSDLLDHAETRTHDTLPLSEQIAAAHDSLLAILEQFDQQNHVGHAVHPSIFNRVSTAQLILAEVSRELDREDRTTEKTAEQER